jgi:hypothetical protein
MKVVCISLLAIIIIASCKKKDIATCETTMAEIAGNYKLSKLEKVYYNPDAIQNVTNTLTPCELSAVYVLKTDSTAVYTEPGTCTGNSTGSWYTQGAGMFIFFSSGNGSKINSASFTSWDCTSLVLTTMYPTVAYNYRYTLSKL